MAVSSIQRQIETDIREVSNRIIENYNMDAFICEHIFPYVGINNMFVAEHNKDELVTLSTSGKPVDANTLTIHGTVQFDDSVNPFNRIRIVEYEFEFILRFDGPNNSKIIIGITLGSASQGYGPHDELKESLYCIFKEIIETANIETVNGKKLTLPEKYENLNTESSSLKRIVEKKETKKVEIYL